jgi:hypothetical protein
VPYLGQKIEVPSGTTTMICVICKRELPLIKFRVPAPKKAPMVRFSNCIDCYARYMKECRERYNDKSLVEKEAVNPWWHIYGRKI